MISNYKIFILSVSFLCGFCSLLPFICGYHIPKADSSDPEPSNGIDSDMIEKINFGMMVASLVLLFESFLDWNTFYVSIDYSLPRWGLIFACLFTSILFFSFESASNELKLELCVCCFYARACFFSGCLLFQVENQASLFSQFIAILIQFSLLITVQLYLWKSFFRVGLTMYVISTFFAVISGIICIYYLIRTTWVYGVQPLFTDIDTPSNIKKLRLVIATCCGLYIFGNFLITLSYGSKAWPQTTTHELMSYFILDLFILVVGYHLPGRMAHVDAAMLQFQLQSKRAFVRYVGHEIRTPLNTVSLGLDLIQSNIKSYLEKTSSITTVPILNQISRMVTEVSDSSSIAIDILNDMLLYDKIEEGNIVIYPEKIDTNHLLTSLVNNFSIQAQHSQISLFYDPSITSYPPKKEIIGAEIYADKSKISQVLRNFISNALKFTPAGGQVRIVLKFFPGTPDITPSANTENRGSSFSSIVRDAVRSRVTNSAVFVTNIEIEEVESGMGTNGILRIEVHDTGHGISKENQEKLFKSVIQFDTAALQNGKGSGLGLFISNAIIEQHHGKIGVSSSGIRGEGSIFYAELPAFAIYQSIPLQESRTNENSRTPPQRGQHSLIEEEGENTTEIETPNIQSQHLRLPQQDQQQQHQQEKQEIQEKQEKLDIPLRLKCALVVDDSKMNRKMLIQALSPHFDEILQAEDGQQALDVYSRTVQTSNQISIIFMDSLMPVMTGIEATTSLRRLGYTGPIIGVTGNMMQEDVEQFLSAGATEVIAKPLKLDKLHELILNVRDPTTRYNDLHPDENVIETSHSPGLIN